MTNDVHFSSPKTIASPAILSIQIYDVVFIFLAKNPYFYPDTREDNHIKSL